MKKCLIVNDVFSWWMEVDGHTITFDGVGAAEYFEKHYRELGYEVEVDKHRWRE